MKKFLFSIFILFLMSCDDGDLAIETIDFDSVDIQDCGNVDVGKSNILFKITDKEALILTLANGTLKNEVTETDISSAVPGSSKVTYRVFSDNVTKNYFCDEIPPTEPTVIDEIDAQGGTVFIKTTTEDNITFTHEISLSEISFVTSTDTRITDLRINRFGTVTTKVE